MPKPDDKPAKAQGPKDAKPGKAKGPKDKDLAQNASIIAAGLVSGGDLADVPETAVRLATEICDLVAAEPEPEPEPEPAE